MKTQRIMIFAALIAGSGYSQAQGGVVDGFNVTWWSQWYDKAYAITIQDDQKIILAGASLPDTHSDFAVVRFGLDGMPDPTFDSDGTVNVDFSGQQDEAHVVVVQADGKILVAGKTSNGSDENFALARFNENGSLDVTFGSGGKVTTDFAGNDDYITDIVLQADGKILAVGFTQDGTENIAVARYTVNGSLDPAFDSDGKLSTDIFSSNESACAVEVLTGGKILVAATADGPTSDFVLLRYLSDGTLDDTFDSDGILITDVSGADDFAYDMCLQTDDKILVAGGSEVSGSYQFSVARFMPNGTLDNTFGTGGIVLSAVANFTGVVDERATGVAVHTDGRITLAGTSDFGSFNTDYALLNLTPAGLPDPTFGTNGAVNYNFGMPDKAWGIVIRADDKIVVTGETGIRMGTVTFLSGYAGIESVQAFETNGLTLYPNPANEAIRIQPDFRMSDAQIQIYSMQGKLITAFSNVSGASADIDLSEMPAGIYQVILTQDELRYTTKFVKKQ